MKMKLTLLVVASILMATGNIFAQFSNPYVENFGTAREFNLGYPNTNEGVQILPVGIDLWEGNDNNTIHYGKVPANSGNKPVLVFVHGYASNAYVFFEGDDNMYWDVYRDGYRSAFVSLTPNKHMWTNGNMLSNMIDQIANHYGEDEVIVVGWSKGGVDIDAALVHFGANDKVSQAFTLSTPHYGTGIAELANSVLLSLVNIIFMQNNDATVCLQRGYMSYFRSITNNNSNNTVGYTTIGGWGNGPLNRLSIPQGYLYLAGGSKSSGGNDGVVPYSSSRRPGGNELFGGLVKKYGFLGIPYYDGPDETDLDHFEVTRGGLVWPHIKANINGNARLAPNFTSDYYNPNAVISSRMQIVTSQGTGQEFLVEENAGKVTVLVGSTTESTTFTIRNQAGLEVRARKVSQEQLDGQAQKSIYELEGAQAGAYRIESSGEFAAIIMTEAGIEATFDTGLDGQKLVYTQGDQMDFKLELKEVNGQVITDALVTGTMLRTTDLQLNKQEDEPQAIAFQQVGNQFVAKVSASIPAGIYNITLNAKGKGFTKHIVTSIAIVGNQRFDEGLEKNNLDLAIGKAYPNPFHGKLAIELSGVNANTKLTIYNVFGQEVKRFDLANQLGQVNVEWDTSKNQLESGLYILQLTDGKKKVTKKVVMN